MNNDTKIKIIKDGTCILGAILVLVLFFVLASEKEFYKNLNSYLPFLMLELLIGVFSFYWSISKANKQSLVNILIIIGTMVVALLYIVFGSICAVGFASSSQPNESILVVTAIFFSISWVCITFCLLSPIYIDFFADKSKKNKISKQ